MIRYLPLILLAACSQPAPTPAPTATPTPVTTASAPTAQVQPLPAQESVAAIIPKPGTLKTFRDWSVGCDNGLRCQMASLGPEAGGDFPAVAMMLTREAGPDGRYSAALTAVQSGDAVPTAVTVDGKPLTDPNAIATAMAAGRTMTVGRSTDAISLAGAAAALRYIDAAQHRAGGQSATVAKGLTPKSAVPAAPPVPEIMITTATGAPEPIGPALAASMRKNAGCEEGDTASRPIDSFALGSGKTLALVPCSVGAYNLSSALFVVAGGTAMPAQTDAPIGFRSDGDHGPQVVNGRMTDGVLEGYAKGRGLGDCGVGQRFAWDGAWLRLIEQSEMSECRANPRRIVTWRATVVRR